MSKQLSFRIPEEVWDRAVALAERMNAHTDYLGHPVSPSRVLTIAMSHGIEPLEKRYGPKKRGRR